MEQEVVSIFDVEKFPKEPGIYMIFDKSNAVVYVGQSSNIYERWSNGHHKLTDIIRECGDKARIEWILVSKKYLNRVESALYHAYKPRLNSKAPPLF